MPTTTDLAVRGRGALWIVPLVLDAAGKIDSLGTPILIDAVVDAKPLYAKDAAASKGEVISVQTQTGITIEVPKKSKTIDGSTGATKTAAGGSAAGDKISATILNVGKTKRRLITATRGQPCLVVSPSAESLDGSAEEDFQAMIGRLTSDVSPDIKAEGFITLGLEWTGGETFTATTSGATALAVDLAAITPRGEVNPVDPPAITSGNVTALLKGNIVDL